MILLVRHPAVDAGGRCYGRLDLDVADPANVGELAQRIAAEMKIPLPLREGLGEGCQRQGISAERTTPSNHVRAPTPSPGPLPRGEGEKTVWTSPARRCRVVAEALGPHRVDDRLQELDFGTWEGLPWDDVPRASLDAWASDPWGFAPPGGESGSALVARVRAFAAVLTEGCHIVITHGGPLKVLLAGNDPDLLAAPPAPGSVTRLRHHPG